MEKKKEKLIDKVFVVMSNGDWFKCSSCEYTVRMRVLGNSATCSRCGGRMNRL